MRHILAKVCWYPLWILTSLLVYMGLISHSTLRLGVLFLATFVPHLSYVEGRSQSLHDKTTSLILQRGWIMFVTLYFGFWNEYLYLTINIWVCYRHLCSKAHRYIAACDPHEETICCIYAASQFKFTPLQLNQCVFQLVTSRPTLSFYLIWKSEPAHRLILSHFIDDKFRFPCQF